MRICVFSGTTEGHELSRFLAANGVPAEVFVATEYGAAVMEPMPGITVHEGRLDENEIAARLDADTLLIDATHPYAALVTDNLRTACAKTGARYERLLRPALRYGEGETVPDTEAAVAWLSRHPGKVLLTTGSKELEAYTAVENFAERLYPRVLPSVGVIQKCASLGFPGSHIIAMQGPFSAGMNAALIRQTGAEILVTKDTGATGGFAEKLAAARETGIKTLIIARPREESGRSLAEMQAFLCEELGLAEEKKQTAPPRFPLFVPLEGRRCAVFGAGKIAARRAAVLRRFGACVTVTAPEKRAEIEINLCRGYEKSDLSGVFLAVAATDDRTVNHRIAEDCASLGIPVSVADSASESTFFFPAVCEGAELTVGVVSRGTSHAKTAEAARRIRRVLEEMT